jgi:carboxypeptidase T
MTKKLFLPLLTLAMLATTSLSAADDAHYWMKFKANDKYQRSTIADLGVTIEAVIEDSVIAIGTKENLEAAKKTGMLEVSFQLDQRMLDFPKHDSNFHNYSELMKVLEEVAAQYPQLVKLSTIGKSLNGLDIPMITFSTTPDDLSKPAVFFMGGHHAREHLSVELPLNLIRYLAQEYAAGNKRIVSLLENRTVYIAPVINPDGKEHDIATGSYKLWRKNRRENGAGSYGVDLNRNYGYMWGGGGASSNPRADTYRGATAFSEPETQAVKAFFESHRNITITLSFHTFSELILYPWGHKYDAISNPRDFAVHKTMADTMAVWNRYKPQQSSELYIASGDTTDWAYGQLGIISFTFELDPRMTPDKQFNPEAGFYPGQSLIDPVFRKNLEPSLYLIEYSDNPYRVLDHKGVAYGLNSPLVD